MSASDLPPDIWSRLEALIAKRRAELPADSYVVELIRGGHPAQAAKLVEETYELIEAAGEEAESPVPIVHEAADVLFHLLVLLGERGIAWSTVEAELGRRFGISGLAEKAARMNPPPAGH